MAYGPHKYWSYNEQADIEFATSLLQYNVPIYFGESGENSNAWFRDAIKLFEDNHNLSSFSAYISSIYFLKLSLAAKRISFIVFVNTPLGAKPPNSKNTFLGSMKLARP